MDWVRVPADGYEAYRAAPRQQAGVELWDWGLYQTEAGWFWYGPRVEQRAGPYASREEAMTDAAHQDVVHRLGGKVSSEEAP